MKISKFLLIPLLSILPLQSRGEAKLPKVFTDHMVLQRGVPIHIWGQATPGEAIKVTLEADAANGTTDALGRWSLYLPARPAGGPYQLVVQAKNKIALSDILVGDLWLASGQSNMEMPVGGFPNSAVIKDSAQEIASAHFPQIRLLRLNKGTSAYPLDDLKSVVGWQTCAPETVKDFSAVGYFFGRDLYEQEKVPIGLIDSTWGGTPAEAWISQRGLSRSPALKAVWESRADDMDAEESVLLQRVIDKQAAAAGKTVPRRPADMVEPWLPSGLYNAMIAPLTGLPIRGVIWYQGEANTGVGRTTTYEGQYTASHGGIVEAEQGRSAAYEEVFETLIQDWRSKWQVGDFPFLYVQLASFGSGGGWPIVREAQRRTLALKNTGMAVAIDVGEEQQVHPAQKQIVGRRLSLLARSIAYGEPVVSNGPLFRQAAPTSNSMRVLFDSADGLTGKGGPVGGFEVAGEDGAFSAAAAQVEGNTILAHSAKVPHPVYVRYAWKGFPKDANLYNGAGLPASPFTSEAEYANDRPIR